MIRAFFNWYLGIEGMKKQIVDLTEQLAVLELKLNPITEQHKAHGPQIVRPKTWQQVLKEVNQ